MNRVEFGDCRETMRRWVADGVKAQMCVTSPPYFGLRSYLPDDHPDKALEIGLEQTPEQFIAGLVDVFRAVRDVLADDGVLWVNMGDSYASGGRKSRDSDDKLAQRGMDTRPADPDGIKPKDLIGIPWMLAFALRADGWYLRQDIIWHKPNPMPESVTDRCTKAHESIFLLAKSKRYFYDHEAVKEPAAPASLQRWAQDIEQQAGSDRVPGKTNGPMKAVGGKGGKNAFRGQGHFRDGDKGPANRDGRDMQDVGASETRNKRSVWTVATVPYSGAHFATFPPALIEPCILAGSKPGQIVLDPFFGSGTTGMVAQNLGRQWLGCELNPAYKALQDERLSQPGLMLEAA